MKSLVGYDNVRLYFFMNDRDVILNLDENYMDTLHFSPRINEYICNCLADDTDVHRVKEQDIDEVISDMSILAGQITDEYMEPYVSLIKTQ